MQSVTLKLIANGVLLSPVLHSDSSGSPGTSLATLASTRVLSTNLTDYVFTCSSGCQLASGTTYHIEVNVSRTENIYWGQNTSGTETNTPTNAGWSIADDAKYQDGQGGDWMSEGAVKLMKVTWAFAPDLWVENVGFHTAHLALRNWTSGQWSYKVTGPRNSGCHNSVAPHSPFVTLDSLSLGSNYTVTAYSGSGCVAANLLDTETFTTRAADWLAPALSVSGIGNTGATLSIANHTGDWWYADTADNTTCTKVDAGTDSVTLSGLTSNKFYQYEAYSAAGCANSTVPLDWFTPPVDFTTTGTVTATITDLSDTTATLTVNGITSEKWSTKHRVTGDPLRRDSPCLTYGSSTTEVTVTGLTAGTAYTFYVYSGDSCLSLHDRIVTQAHTFRLTSGNVGSTSATLKMENYNDAWYHQQAGGSASGQAASQTGGCSTAINGDTANLTGLTPDTEYIWKAYKAEGCADADAIASTSFTTATAGTHPPTGEEPDQAEAEAEAAADLQPTFGAYTIGNQSYEPHQAIGTLTLPAATSGNGPLTYALTPDPPAGLMFDAATRTLSGTPTGARPATTYTYTATDADVSEPDVARLTFTIEVVLSAAEQAILEDGLAAQGRALLSGATGVIGERFRNPGASSVAEAGVAACLGNAGPGAEDAGGEEPECATGLLTTVAQAMLGMSGSREQRGPLGDG